MAHVMELVRRYGIDPKRSLGQNFLIAESHLDRIVDAAELTPEDVVMEIGPGVGTLTARLAAQCRRVVAVELDDRLIDLLRAEFAGQPHVEILHGDILDMEPSALVQASVSYKVVANLPYYITSAVLRHLLEAAHPPALAVVMVQREVAERICSQPGKLSLLAVSVQFYARPQIVHHVPAGAFYPAPKVDSSVLRLDVRPERALPDVSPDRFFRVVRAGFSQKRKQLANSLAAGLALPKPAVIAALTQASVDPARRAETLGLAEWGHVCAALGES